MIVIFWFGKSFCDKRSFSFLNNCRILSGVKLFVVNFEFIWRAFNDVGAEFGFSCRGKYNPRSRWKSKWRRDNSFFVVEIWDDDQVSRPSAHSGVWAKRKEHFDGVFDASINDVVNCRSIDAQQ